MTSTRAAICVHVGLTRMQTLTLATWVLLAFRAAPVDTVPSPRSRATFQLVNMAAWKSKPDHPCVAYEPDTVALVGRLERHTYPGPPNYESIANGDARETGYYLRPDEPLCATGSQQSDWEPVAGVRLVQLVLDAAGYRDLRALLGQHVRLRGTLFHAHTGHHHATLLLTVISP
jgi:Domain of unknown function (DUF4431)